MKLKITVEGKQYEVEVEVEEQAPVGGHAYAPRPVTVSRSSSSSAAPAAAAPAAGGANVADDKAVKSPLMGVVQTLEVSAGQEVEADQPMVVLEAMKMLTTITAPRKAKVKALHIGLGDSVAQGQLLVEFE